MLITRSAFSQSTKIDSLINITKKGTATEKIDALNKLCGQLMYDKPEEAKVYALESIRILPQFSHTIIFLESEISTWICGGIWLKHPPHESLSTVTTAKPLR